MGNNSRIGDRMRHPLNHNAAVVGGVAFVVLAGCVSTIVADGRMWRSGSWWTAFGLASTTLVVCVIGYFRPQSQVIYVPVVLSGLVLFGLCVWYFWGYYVIGRGDDVFKRLIHSLVFFGFWVAWVVRMAFELADRHPLPETAD